MRSSSATSRRWAASDRVADGPEAFLTDDRLRLGPNLARALCQFRPPLTSLCEICAVGRGTGLGLSTCHGVVSQAGGILSVRSELGAGTTFCIHLPREIAARDRTSIPVAENARGGGETVLVVEDDDQVRTVVMRILLGLGYQVLEAPSGQRAIEIVRRVGTEIDLVLTDMVLPGMGGIEVVEAVRSERPETRILFMSGYTKGVSHEHPLLKHGARLLQKPITPEALARKVRKALDARRHGC